MTFHEQSTTNSRTSSVSLSGSEDDEGNDQVALDWSGHRQNSKLFDREDQRKLLLDHYYRARDFQPDQGKPPELLLINGKSGIGKSALAVSIREDVLHDGGFFILGKFVAESDNHQQQSSHQRQPFAPYVSALNQLAQQISDREPSFWLRIGYCSLRMVPVVLSTCSLCERRRGSYQLVFRSVP